MTTTSLADTIRAAHLKILSDSLRRVTDALEARRDLSRLEREVLIVDLAVAQRAAEKLAE